MIADAMPTLGTASKIYGMMNFFEQGTYGRIGANGLTAIKGTAIRANQIAYWAHFAQFWGYRGSPEGSTTSAVFKAPEVFASSGETREAFVADLPQVAYVLWEPGDRMIAQLEWL